MRRLKVWQHAKIVFGPEMRHCMIRDISNLGAMLAIKQTIHIPDVFDLYIAAHSLRVYRAQLVWRNRDFAGVSFVPDQEDGRSTVGA